MTELFRHVPLDDPDLSRLEDAHAIDRDPVTTATAISIVHDARAAGHPGDPAAAKRVLTGPSAAAAVQVTMQPHVDEAIGHDKAAEQHSTEAVQWAQEAREAAERRLELPDDAVSLADGSSLTRGQVHERHGHLLQAAALREGRGDLEHHAAPPGRAVRAVVVAVLSTIEVFLLIWPVTNASWADPASVAYVAGLVILFLFMNEQLPRLAGLAIRHAREALHAARELTSIGLSAGRSGKVEAGRQITGHVDERLVLATKRRRTVCCTVLAVVLAVYAAVMFIRVERLAAGLGWSLPFVLLAACLITAFTAGSVLIMTTWWSRGNALGDQLREHGAVTSQSRAIAEDLASQSRADARSSADAADQVHRELDLGEQAMHAGYRDVMLVMQKAAKILDQDSVLAPKAKDLLAAGRPIRARASGNLKRADDIIAEAQQLLGEPAPFRPSGATPSAWELRTAPRQAPPNPRFIDPHQLGALHAPAGPDAAARRSRRPLLPRSRRPK